MNFKFLQSAFDKLGGQTGLLEEIRDNTEQTAVALNPGGELFDRMDRLVQAMENLESAAAGGKGGLQQAILLKLVSPTLKPIGLGLGFIVDALEKAGPGKELAEKMDALTKGLVLLGDVGASILKFAGYMILATPLLLVAAVASIIWVPATILMIKGLMYATEGLDEERMKKIVLLGDVGASILKLAGSLALVALLAIPALVGLLATTVILVGIAGVFKILDMIGADPKRMENFGDSIKSLGLGLLLLSGTLALISIVAMPVLKGLAVAMAVIAGIGLTFFLLDKLGVDKSMRTMSLSLMLVSLSIVTLATALALADILMPPLERTLEIGAIIGGTAIVFALAGLLKTQIVQGALVMALAGISLVVIGFGLQMIEKALPDKDRWEFIGQVGAIVGGLGVAMALAGAGAAFIAAGAGVMILAGGALVVIGLGLKTIASVDFATLGALSNGKGNKPFDWSGEVSEGFLGFGAGRKKTNFEVAMEAIAAGMALGPVSIAGILAGAPTLILASTALVGIAVGLRTFKAVVAEADLPKLSDNVNYIVSGLADTFAQVGQKYPGGGGGIMSALFGSGSDTSVVAQGISAVSGMGRALKGIAKGVQAMAELKFPTGFDKDGNPTGYETINLTTAVPALIANTQLIVTGLSKTFAEVGESDAAQGSTWFTSSSYEKGIKVVKKMGEPLYNLANGVQNMANLKFPTGYDKDGNPTGFKSIGNVGSLVKKLTKNTKAIIIGLAGVFEEVGKSDAADTGWFSKNNFEKGIYVAQQLADPYESLADAVQYVNEITSGLQDAQEVKGKVTAMISAITDAGGTDASVLSSKAYLIRVIGSTYEKLSTAIPAIVSSIATFTVDKAKAFAAIFGGESPAELFESKTKFLGGLTASYMRMAMAIPLIVGSINSVQAEQLDSFTAIYGGKMTEIETMTARESLFVAVGDSYEKVGRAVPQITSAISGVDPEAFDRFKGLFIGKVGMIRPIAGYEAQAALWDAIGRNMGATATAFPTIAEGINAMDLAKLTETRQMFEALAVLAEGGESPEDILEAMGESLSTALENLTDMIETFRTTVETGNAETGGILEGVASTVGGAVGAFRDAVTGGGGAGDSRQVVTAIQNLQRQLLTVGIKLKNQDLFG